MGFASFMSSGWGRVLRIVAGAVLIYLGLFSVTGWLGIVLVIVGLIPFLAGIFDVCVIGRLFLGTPFKGSDLRGQQ
ncbi:MAG: DUF2892 domain-containing protein [Anaerolineales bacterium]